MSSSRQEEEHPADDRQMYDDFIRLFFLHSHREVSVLVIELPEESDQFRCLKSSRFANLKGAVGLIRRKHRLCG